MRWKLALFLPVLAFVVYWPLSGHREGGSVSQRPNAPSPSSGAVARGPQTVVPSRALVVGGASRPVEPEAPKSHVEGELDQEGMGELAQEGDSGDFVDLEWEQRLAEMRPELARFFNKRSATYEEWSLAYKDYLCSCPDLECAKVLQDDFASRKPHLVDLDKTERAVAAVEEALICAGRLAGIAGSG